MLDEDEMTTNEGPDRLQEAAIAILSAAPGRQLNIVSLNKALFYLDLIALKETGRTVTRSPYIALLMGPVVAKYQKRLIEKLVNNGYAEQLQIDKARPLRLTNPPASFQFLTAEQVDQAMEMARFASGMTSTLISSLSHENPGWEIAFEDGVKLGKSPKPIDMTIALQQLIEDDPWLEERPTPELIAIMETAADEVGQTW